MNIFKISQVKRNQLVSDASHTHSIALTNINNEYVFLQVGLNRKCQAHILAQITGESAKKSQNREEHSRDMLISHILCS